MKEQELLNAIQENPFICAPMAGITDNAFRSFIKKMGSSVVISELVSANGLKYANEKTKTLMHHTPDQYPIAIQIFGEDAEPLAEATKYCEDIGVDFVDLNMGCPVGKVVKKGAGSALMKDLPKLKKILRAMKNATSLPVTIKIRTGWDKESRNALEVAQLAYDEGITWVGIHGRTRSQAYEGLADWDYIKYIKENSPLPIIGNGDITTPELAVEKLKYSGCDAVMIGRGCLKNPWIFKQSLDLWKNQNTKEENKNFDFIWMIQELIRYLEEKSSERILLIQIKKLTSWFSTGHPNSAQYRKKIFSIKDKDELINYVFEYFNQLKINMQEDTSKERFLMGGHG